MASYIRIYPEVTSNPPVIHSNNYGVAASFAILNQQIGNTELADRLLRESLNVMERAPTVGISAHGLVYVLAHTASGDTDKALASLKSDLATGWGPAWWLLRVEPVFEPLWSLPEFQSLMSEVDAEMAGQLANLREMEKSGELAEISGNEGNLN